MKIKPSVFLNVVLAAGLAVVSAHLAASKKSLAQSSAKSSGIDSVDAVYDNIMTRTSVRSYANRPIEKEKIEKMLHAGMAAPTAMNRQPWHFIVVDDRALLDAIAEATPNAGMAKKAPLPSSFVATKTSSLRAAHVRCGRKTHRQPPRTSCFKPTPWGSAQCGQAHSPQKSA